MHTAASTSITWPASIPPSPSRKWVGTSAELVAQGYPTVPPACR